MTANAAPRRIRRETLGKHVAKHYWLYLMLIPGLAFFAIFHYWPMYGIVIAFKKFALFRGIAASPWVGFQHFQELFSSDAFGKLLQNSVLISLYKLFWGFPAPILLALLLNEVKRAPFKRTVQTIIYLPHFVSWVVIAGLLTQLLSPNGGVVNLLIKQFGGEPIYFLAKPQYFRTIIVASDIWKSAGWGTIIYLAALTNIDPTLYEAAVIDGANRLRQTWHVTMPGIKSTIVVMLLLRTSTILGNNFDQMFVMLNNLVMDVGDVFETYVYRVAIRDSRFDFATAVGLFQSVVGMVMLLTCNAISRRLGEGGIL